MLDGRHHRSPGKHPRQRLGVVDVWDNTTHDWATTVDQAHLRLVAAHPDRYCPGGVRHLLHEVLAYVADELEAVGRGSRRCDVTLLADGSVRVRDYGRGTDTRRDSSGTVVRKPVMATRDLRFFDAPDAVGLPDGHPRRGMSVVAALSDWLVHENHRDTGSWRQRYERGLPAEDLQALEPDGTTGTSVHYRPSRLLEPLRDVDLESLPHDWPTLELTCSDQRQVLAARRSPP